MNFRKSAAELQELFYSVLPDHTALRRWLARSLAFASALPPRVRKAKRK